MKDASCPFQFLTVSYLVQILDIKAATLEQLAGGLEKCSDASIFYHTFQSLRRHHFLTKGFSNDFAQWILASCNRAELAEQLAILDIREYTSLAALRADLRRIVEDYCRENPSFAAQQAFEEFSFCEALEVTTPLGDPAWSLREFNERLKMLSHASLYYHFIASRLRLHLQTNDFSTWLEGCLGLKSLANSVNHVDIYTNTLDSLRTILTQLIEPVLNS